MQIRASMTEDGKFIICGSEDGNIIIWNTIYIPMIGCMNTMSRHNVYTNQSYESINCTENRDVAVTSTVFAPALSVYHTLINEHQHYRLQGLGNDDLKQRIDDVLPGSIEPITFCSRIFVSADYEGVIRVYIRED